MKRLIGLMLVTLSTIAISADSEFEACRNKLVAAQKLDVLHDLQWTGKKPPRVVAGRTFFTIPIDAKEGFAETVNCFLMAGDRDKFVNFDILDWRTGKPVGSFTYGKYKHH